VDTESLLLKLMPEATISGHVIDESGDPVKEATIKLYRENRDRGDVRIMQVGFAQTNELGEYDVDHLQPGTYYLLATATPWYAIHPQSAQPARRGQPGQQNAVQVVDSFDPSLDVAYPTIFYPEATDSASAEAIQVRPAEQRNIDLRLFPVPAVTVTIPRPSDNKIVVSAILRQKVFGQLEPFQGELRYASPTTYAISGVPPGEYVLQQSDDAPGAITRSVRLNLTTGSASASANAEQELGNIKLQFKALDGGSLPIHLQVALIAKDVHSVQSA